MKVLVLILMIQCILADRELLTNETLAEIDKINEMEYSYEIIINGHEAKFIFTVHNTTYAKEKLGIDSYYYSITFAGEEHHEEREPIANLSTHEIEYQGTLTMLELEEEEGNYLICVIFLNGTTIIASSRFCHVVSVSGSCSLEPTVKTFNDRHILVVLAFVFVILTITVVFTCIRDYVYRPHTIEAILKTLPEHHAQNLETLAPTADERRRRRTQPALTNRLREASVLTIEYDPNADLDFHNYHGHDNVSLEILDE